MSRVVTIPLSRPRVFYGWWIVLATVVMQTFTAGTVFWSFSFVATPMREEFGWGATVVSIAYVVQGAVSAFLAPLFGVLFDRLGPRRVAAGGLVLGGLGLVLMGRASEPWQLYAAFTLAGMGPTAAFGAALPAVGNWFVRRLGLAMGLASMGIAFAGGMAPVTAVLVAEFGWRAALTIAGVTTWVLMLPLVLVLRRRPEDVGLLPDGDQAQRASAPRPGVEPEGATVREAFRGAPFWLIGYVFIMGYWAVGALQVHQTPYLETAGFSRQAAAAMLTLLSLTTIVGRVAFGWLADRRDLRWLTGGALGLQALGLALFGLVDASRSWLLAAFLLTYASGLGGILVLQPAVQGRYFGRRAFGALAGLYFGSTSISWSAGPYVLGLIFDTVGDYRPGFFLFTALTLLGIPGLLALRRPRRRGAPEPVPAATPASPGRPGKA